MKEISFEKALKKLNDIVEALENGELSLDDSLKKYEDGIKLARECQKKIDKAKAKIELLMKDKEGNFSTKKFEEEIN